MKALSGEPRYARLFTPLDRMMSAWLAEGWAPQHRTDANGTVRVSRESSVVHGAGIGVARSN